MALGGSRRAIVRFVLQQAMAHVGAGIIAGALFATPVAWLLHGVLLDVRPFDPIVLGTVPAVLLAAGSLDCMLPALRATRVDPQLALASE